MRSARSEERGLIRIPATVPSAVFFWRLGLTIATAGCQNRPMNSQGSGRIEHALRNIARPNRSRPFQSSSLFLIPIIKLVTSQKPFLCDARLHNLIATMKTCGGCLSDLRDPLKSGNITHVHDATTGAVRAACVLFPDALAELFAACPLRTSTTAVAVITDLPATEKPWQLAGS